MSSHHIVRDEQEPALILDQLENFPVEHLHNLLEWSPTVVVFEPELERYTSLGHKLDVAVIHASRISYWQQELANQQPVKLVGINDQEFLETGLLLLQRNQHHSINVVTGDLALGRTFELLKKWADLLNLVVFTPQKRYLIHQGNFVKWLAAGSTFSVQVFDESVKIKSIGFDQNFEGELSQKMDFAKSEEGEIQILCDQTIILVEDL